MKTRRIRPLSAMIGAWVALAACASLPTRVDPSRAAIRLSSVDMAGHEPSVRDQCTGAIERALRRHGFVLGASGASVDVHVAFWDRMQVVLVPEFQATADLTARVRDGRAAWEVMASGSGTDAHGTGAPMTPRGRSYYAACEAGAERLAAALVEGRGGAR
jgi:hypothetical protein